MEPGDIDAKLTRLWEAVREHTSALPEGMPEPREENAFAPLHARVAEETIGFMKSRHREEVGGMRELLEHKEREVRGLKRLVEEFRDRVERLEEQAAKEREESMGTMVDASMRVEETQRALEEQRKVHERESELLRKIAERTQRELDALRQRWTKEKSQLRGVLQKKEKMFLEKHDTLGQLEYKHAQTEKALREAKLAVESTLAELLGERKAKMLVQEDKSRAERRVEELEKHLKQVRSTWEAERKEWRELWERERSTWETHRQEFQAWELKLRRERQAWVEKMRQHEERDVQSLEKMSRVLQESSDWSRRVTAILKFFAMRGARLPTIFASESVPEMTTRFARNIAKGVAVVAVLAAGGAWFYHGWLKLVRYELVSATPLDTPNATGVAATPEQVWIADWERGLKTFSSENPTKLIKSFPLLRAAPYHPAAISINGDFVWTLDLAQLRVLRHRLDRPTVVLPVATPGPAPTAAAFDGRRLWTFDASTGLLYKYALNPKEGFENTYRMPQGVVPTSMQWMEERAMGAGAELWAFDAKTRRLHRMQVRGDEVVALSSQSLFERAAAFAVSGETLWVLAESEQGGARFELRRYKITSRGL